MEAKLLDDMVEALTETSGVDPHEVRAAALRMYLNLHPTLKLDGAVALWRTNRVSLARAAEIAGLTVPELQEVLAARSFTRETEGKRTAELDANLDLEEILRALKTKTILVTYALAALIEQIEQEDRTRIKAKTDLLTD